MADNAASGPPVEDTPGASSEVGGAAPNDGGYVSEADFKKLQSTYDRQVSERDRLIAEMRSELDAVQQQRRNAELENLSPSEQVAYERDELRRRVTELEQQNQATQAKVQYAQQLAAASGVSADVLLQHDSPDQMLKAAIDSAVQSQIPEGSATPSPGPAPGGATLTEPEPEKTLDELRADSFASGDREAFIKSFMPRRD